MPLFRPVHIARLPNGSITPRVPPCLSLDRYNSPLLFVAFTCPDCTWCSVDDGVYALHTVVLPLRTFWRPALSWGTFCAYHNKHVHAGLIPYEHLLSHSAVPAFPLSSNSILCLPPLSMTPKMACRSTSLMCTGRGSAQLQVPPSIDDASICGKESVGGFRMRTDAPRLGDVSSAPPSK